MKYESVQEEASSLMEKHRDFYVKSSIIEKKGYEEWPRAREIVELIKDMGYKKVGLAFCSGLIREAILFSEILQEHGIDLISVMCKVGGVDKSVSGIPEEFLSLIHIFLLFMVGYTATTSFGIYYFKYIYGDENMYAVFALSLIHI